MSLVFVVGGEDTLLSVFALGSPFENTAGKLPRNMAISRDITLEARQIAAFRSRPQVSLCSTAAWPQPSSSALQPRVWQIVALSSRLPFTLCTAEVR